MCNIFLYKLNYSLLIYLNDLTFLKLIHIIVLCHYSHTVKVDCFKYRDPNIYKTIFMFKLFWVERHDMKQIAIFVCDFLKPLIKKHFIWKWCTGSHVLLPRSRWQSHTCVPSSMDLNKWCNLKSEPSLKHLTEAGFGVPKEKQRVSVQELVKAHIESFDQAVTDGLCRVVEVRCRQTQTHVFIHM